MDDDSKKSSVTISNCVTQSDVLRYFVSVFFSFVLITFCLIMIAVSSNPSSETLWISLATSTFSIYLPQPQIKK